MKSKPRIVIWLTLLVLLPVIPLFFFSLYSAQQYAKERQLAVESDLTQRAEAITNHLQSHLEKTLGYLNGLAVSEASNQGDVAALYRGALRIQASNPDIVGISLIDRAGKLVFLAPQPLGTLLPTGQPEAVKEVFEFKRPVLSEPYQSSISKYLVVALGVPVFQNGEVIYCIRALLTTESINSVLKQMPLPLNGISGVFSPSGVTIGRSKGPEFIGQSSPNILKAIRDHRQGSWDALTKENVLTRTVIRPVGNWKWYVAVGVPSEILNAPLRSEIAALASFGAVLLGVALVAAAWISRRITRGLKGAVEASRSVLDGTFVAERSSGILEIDQMRDSLTAVDVRSKWLEQKVSERTQDLTQARARLGRFVVEQERVVEAERHRISREVHDQIGSVLTGLKMIFRGIPKGCLPSDQEVAFLEALDLGIMIARRIASELRPPLIDDLGLQAALQHLLGNMSRAGSVAFSVQLEDQHLLTEHQTIGAYRILQEACTNVARHAQASELKIFGEPVNDLQYLITLCDNGVGLPTPELRHGGLGLTGMQERANLLGGALELDSPAEGGTCLRLRLPLNSPDQPPNL
ncbi:ATP-binding protein [Rhodoferax sp. GW822-FHT02A01]|uniref:sensor histidine kinase n=1 Tax=Rhodoferax sp. GW822-FHT02A01 TaxID=3141537 RepID=UPI00315DFF6C